MRNPIERGLGAKHRLTVCVPMAALGIIDNFICLVTLGFVQTGFALDWGFRTALYVSRRTR